MIRNIGEQSQCKLCILRTISASEVINFITLVPWASKCIERKTLLVLSGTSLLRKKEDGDAAGLSAMQIEHPNHYLNVALNGPNQHTQNMENCMVIIMSYRLQSSCLRQRHNLIKAFCPTARWKNGFLPKQERLCHLHSCN